MLRWGGDEPVLEEEARAWPATQPPGWPGSAAARPAELASPKADDAAVRSFCAAVDGAIQSGTPGPRQGKARRRRCIIVKADCAIEV